MKLEPYVFFYGRCEEALDFYRQVLGGDYEAFRFDGAPMGHQVPADYQNKIMHATFKGPSFEFMASDGPPGKTVDPDAGNIALSLELASADEGKRVFDALAEGGKITVPLDNVDWGGKFGILVDRFGNEWMITSPQT